MQLRRFWTRRGRCDRCPAFTLGALRLPLFVCKESGGIACGEERCAGTFWTNGARGDAFENGLLVSYGR